VPAADADDVAANHRASVEAWRERRVAALTRDTGWLTLSALHRLEPGRYSVGSDPGAALSLPASAPGTIGHLEITETEVVFHPAAGVEVTAAGEPLADPQLLTTDAGGEPTELAVGSVSFFVIDRAGIRFLRVRDSEHPNRLRFAGIDYFEIDPAWRFDARFEAHEPLLEIPVANIVGIVEETSSWGAVVFEHQGTTYRIDALAEPGAERLFLIFADATSGRETYGAGRYLYVDAPDTEGRIELDFNLAYNPPCAFTAFATCPLPPRQNRLPLRVEAGEKSYEGPAGP
jgi:uncharacterized protein (DUF1684 family)